MGKFLDDITLSKEIASIFKCAQEYIWIVSPYIHINSKYFSLLKEVLKNDSIELVILFGKNENNPSRSIKQADIKELKKLPNVTIRYNQMLHAKYYANESHSIISSMNLYSHSENNHECGVLLSQIDSQKMDDDAFKYFTRIVEQSKIIFQNKPIYKSKMLGFKKTYLRSDIIIDDTNQFFTKEKKTTKKQVKSNIKKGYCIRTGIEIPFNTEMPMSSKAYKSWSRYKDDHYEEKYCHYSGEESKGKTSFKKPILRKNWKKI